MANIKRIRVVWSGSAVTGNGVSTHYCSTSDTGLAAGLKAFYTAMAGIFTTSLSWTVPVTGDLVDDVTGHLAGSWTETAGTGGTVAGTNAGQWAQGVGARIKWITGGIHAGRRVVGSTFMVPLIINAYEGSGEITSAYLSSMSSAASGLITAVPSLRILSAPTVYHGTPIDGTSSTVLAALVPDEVSWLRGRRL